MINKKNGNSMIKIYNGDCLEIMSRLKDKSVDAIITDPPYGITNCDWDSVIPFSSMWEQLKRIIKPNGAIVLFGSEPFSSALRMSNLKMYKYDWVWDKIRGVGYLNAKKRPMMSTEYIHVFYRLQPTYNPQMRERKKPRRSVNSGNARVYKKKSAFIGEVLNKKYPVNLIHFSKSSVKEDIAMHPTIKPVVLMEYLIKTYTNEGEIVLDFTMGSGTTLVACKKTNRNGIGIEQDKKYCEIAEKRLKSIDSVQVDLF